MAKMQEFKCPCCGGSIEFDSSVQKMKCPFCDTEFDVGTLSEYAQTVEEEQPEDMSWSDEAGSEWQDGESEGLRTYVCKSCGGEIVGDANTAATACPFCGSPVVMTGQLSGASTAATSCPYCGNPTVVPGQFSGVLKPDYVIPFKLDKKAAKERLKKHLTGKRLLPKAFKSENHISEVKGIYVPFWLYDTDADADIRYRATKTRFWSDSDYDYTETSYYAVHRSGSLGFDHVPVDGSASMENDLMESIEPFDFKEAVDFQTAYLAGYFADKYDVTASECEERANERIRRSTEAAFRDTVRGYASVVPENTSIRLHNGTTKYALYPVWILQTKWKGDNYIFAMNGQTGKFVGNLPTDKNAFARWFLGTTGVVGVITYIILYLIWAL